MISRKLLCARLTYQYEIDVCALTSGPARNKLDSAATIRILDDVWRRRNIGGARNRDELIYGGAANGKYRRRPSKYVATRLREIAQRHL